MTELLTRWRASCKRWYRRWRDARTRARLGRDRDQPCLVACSTWDFPQPTHTFVLQELLGLAEAGLRLCVLHGERGSKAGLAARFRPLRRCTAVVETSEEINRRDLDDLDRSHPGRVDVFLAKVARATGRGMWDLRREPLVLRAATFTRLAESAGARCLMSWFCYDLSFMAMFAAEVLQLPRVLSCHVDHVLEDHPFKCVRLHLQTADLVLAISAQARDELVRIGGAGVADRIQVKRIGVAAAPLLPVRSLPPRKTSPPEILSVCRLEPKKGLHVLIEAAALLRDRGRRFRLQLVGGVDPRHAESAAYAERLRQLVRERGLEHAVDLPGAVGNDRLPALLARATVFAAPYVRLASGDKDGIPTSVVEAMGAGVPIVATDVGALPEVLVDGETALLVPQGDAVALATAIERVLDDEPAARRRAASATACFDREFDSRVCDRSLHDWVRSHLRSAAFAASARVSTT